MIDSLQFFVVKLPDGKFKVTAQDENTILRSQEVDEFQVMDVIQRELRSLQPVEGI